MRSIYDRLKQKIDTLDFTKLYPGFYQMPFALYNDTKVYLESRVIDKTDQFYGNTSIQFEGEPMAIWYLLDTDIDNLDVLASKLVHEMFHAYQMKQNDPRFPNEIQGVRYPYNAQNLSIKHKEHTLIKNLIDAFNEADFKSLCALKSYRKDHYPNAYAYESAIETIEGMAVYVELKALKQLNKETFDQTVDRLKASLVDPLKLVPIRPINYTSGALTLLLAEQNGIDFVHPIGEEKTNISALICGDTPFEDVSIPKTDQTIDHLVNTYKETVKVNIETKLKAYDTHIKGVFDIVGLDPMNTMFDNNTLYCKHILAYKDKDKVHYIKQASVSRVNEAMQLLEIFY